jgi:hypothetical protein
MEAAMLGPQQIPPQGARALVKELLGGLRSAAEVSATLDESDATRPVLEFVNEGRAPAVNLRYFVGSTSGENPASHVVGTLPPGSTARMELRSALSEPFRCVWSCQNRGCTTAWSYEGRRKSFRQRRLPTDAELFALMDR